MSNIPEDAEKRRAIAPVICYPTETLPRPQMDLYRTALDTAVEGPVVIVPPRDAATIRVPAGSFLRIGCPEGPQVGDLNLFNAKNLEERFYSGKTRALHGTHVTEGDQLWSCFPYLRPMATVVVDSLAWYGADEFGGRVHDVIGTRCDPYTGRALGGDHYHYCCHSNLTRALADDQGVSLTEAEPRVHDVLNVFMCTGFTRDTGQYFMKASPVRKGDHLDLFAEVDLLAVLSACPGGDCGSEHSSDTAACYPLSMQILTPADGALEGWVPPQANSYDRTHGR
ncbi:MAG: hypothetical protein RLZ60_1414 [Pseudomonadota bacterium]|uniref:urea carboxylase-associated family protein n=1 Tax=Marivivens sp. TaxID=1978374 RepID=UPI00201F03E7|nr:DUF1989 domain-containing protein [Marivivens sp.]MCL7406695.1 DUF1989 domain-containing protein [Marivivens geojensis]